MGFMTNIWEPFVDSESRDAHSTATRSALTLKMKKEIKKMVFDCKCESCGRKKEIRELEVHHIREVVSADGKYDLNIPSNLIVLCLPCHDKTKKRSCELTKGELRELIKSRTKLQKAEMRAILHDRTKVIDKDFSYDDWYKLNSEEISKFYKTTK